jgi:hypothetical protein
VTDFLLVLPVLLFSVVAHEYAHAWTAFRQGDPTAYMLGRLTLNPLPHIDPMMSVLFPAMLFWLSSLAGHPFTFGAAKPVPVNPRNYRNYRRGDLIVSSAGIDIDPAEFEQVFLEEHMPHSTALHSVRADRRTSYLVGPLARINLNFAKLSPLAQLKVFARGLGLDPDKLILKGSFVKPHRALRHRKKWKIQVQILSSAIKDAIKQEILQDIKSQKIRGCSGGVARI